MHSPLLVIRNDYISVGRKKIRTFNRMNNIVLKVVYFFASGRKQRKLERGNNANVVSSVCLLFKLTVYFPFVVTISTRVDRSQSYFKGLRS